MRGAIPPLPNTPSWRGDQLKRRDNFNFSFSTKQVTTVTGSILNQMKNTRLTFLMEGKFFSMLN
jgi:hypothetical protein